MRRSSRPSDRRQRAAAITEQLVETVKEYEQAGYDHVYFHQVGADQDGFFRFWERELRPALDSR